MNPLPFSSIVRSVLSPSKKSSQRVPQINQQFTVGTQQRNINLAPTEVAQQINQNKQDIPVAAPRTATPIWKVYQYSGFVTSAPADERLAEKNAERQQIHASQNEIRELLYQHRSRGTECSVIKQFPHLRRKIQDDLNMEIASLNQDQPGMDWCIASIEINKGAFYHLSRERRRREERALIILQGSTKLGTGG